jgi:hypothetical protein
MATFLDLQLFLTYNPPATPCSPQTPLHPAAHPYRRLFSAPSNVYSGLLPVFSCNLLDLYSHPPPNPRPGLFPLLEPSVSPARDPHLLGKAGHPHAHQQKAAGRLHAPGPQVLQILRPPIVGVHQLPLGMRDTVMGAARDPGKGARCSPCWCWATGAHRSVACGTVGAVGVRVLQRQLLSSPPRLIDPVQDVGVIPEKRWW